MLIVSIDIGSTWTKGAAFLADGVLLHVQRRATSPTTPWNLAEGFFTVLDDLAEQSDATEALRRGEMQLYYSSSAKGGLAVAALGIVPEITLETAKVAAYSAGAKLTKVLSYRLTRSDIAALEENPPDILLFAGGTDGGNRDYVVANARMLAQSALNCSIVYAGNRAALDDVSEALSGKDFVAVENVLPEIDSPNPDPARAAMRDIFLSRIVRGKGLDTIIKRTGVEPLPTPLAVYEFAHCIRKHVPGWDEFVLLDMGGATTDVYSSHMESPAPGTVLRGLPEPVVKRTVEGDLGLRVSAVAAAESGKGYIANRLQELGYRREEFDAHIKRVAAMPEYLPPDTRGRAFDLILAGNCIAHACARHAGRSHEVSTADGMVRVQVGRDLTHVSRIIGSGGWLARVDDFQPQSSLPALAVDARGKSVLLPQRIEYWRDRDYLFPLLANVARGYPEAAARAGIQSLARSI
ncbi:MAG TPA: glutamate mutase L [Noviherbaspirillum sp.]|uniref:glutamate mutase L n=1 Tax=Noviherbaspirillum sp. TaxID=1926288 RepID=UPI002B493F73|nr:glutamate mutase L [Noviherbaspirillum sp.]HJV88158.1 glutamate mutase L [Noviherbaspirillum sp.]